MHLAQEKVPPSSRTYGIHKISITNIHFKRPALFSPWTMKPRIYAVKCSDVFDVVCYLCHFSCSVASDLIGKLTLLSCILVSVRSVPFQRLVIFPPETTYIRYCNWNKKRKNQCRLVNDQNYIYVHIHLDFMKFTEVFHLIEAFLISK